MSWQFAVTDQGVTRVREGCVRFKHVSTDPGLRSYTVCDVPEAILMLEVPDRFQPCMEGVLGPAPAGTRYALHRYSCVQFNREFVLLVVDPRPALLAHDTPCYKLDVPLFGAAIKLHSPTVLVGGVFTDSSRKLSTRGLRRLLGDAPRLSWVCTRPGCMNKRRYRCGRCNVARYCSPACQAAHWQHAESPHRPACSFFKAAQQQQQQQQEHDVPGGG